MTSISDRCSCCAHPDIDSVTQLLSLLRSYSCDCKRVSVRIQVHIACVYEKHTRTRCIHLCLSPRVHCKSESNRVIKLTWRYALHERRRKIDTVVHTDFSAVFGNSLVPTPELVLLVIRVKRERISVIHIKSYAVLCYRSGIDYFP